MSFLILVMPTLLHGQGFTNEFVFIFQKQILLSFCSCSFPSQLLTTKLMKQQMHHADVGESQLPSFWLKPQNIELNNIWKTIQYTRTKQEANN